MSDSEHDDEFEAYLKRRKSIHKGSAPPDRLEPPAELDRIVIGNARKAIQGGTPLPVYRAPRWALPVALAATILISLAVAFDVGLHARRSAAPFDAQAVGVRAVAEPTPAVSVAPWPPAPSRKATTASTEARATGGADGSLDAARTRRARTEVAATRSRMGEDSYVAANRADEPAPMAEVVVVRKAMAPRAPAQGAADSPASPSSGASPAAADSPAVPSSAASSATADRSVAPSPATSSATADRSAVPWSATSSAAADRSVAPSPAASPAAADRSAAASPTTLVAEADRPAALPGGDAAPEHADAPTWVARIEKLRNEGQAAEVEREIRRFRVAYPDYPLPAEAATHDARAQ